MEHYNKHIILGFIVIEKTDIIKDGGWNTIPPVIKVKLWGITIYKMIPAKY